MTGCYQSSTVNTDCTVYLHAYTIMSTLSVRLPSWLKKCVYEVSRLRQKEKFLESTESFLKLSSGTGLMRLFIVICNRYLQTFVTLRLKPFCLHTSMWWAGTYQPALVNMVMKNGPTLWRNYKPLPPRVRIWVSPIQKLTHRQSVVSIIIIKIISQYLIHKKSFIYLLHYKVT